MIPNQNDSLQLSSPTNFFYFIIILFILIAIIGCTVC